MFVTLQFTFYVSVQPPYIEPIRNQTVLVGEAIFLQCYVFSYSTERIEINWRKSGKPIKITDRVQMTSDGSLWIRRIEKKDAGNYSCVARNSGGESVHSFDVTVYRK